jgi:hypothetical protein
LDGSRLKELNRSLGLTNEVLRHIIVSKKVKTLEEIKAEEKAKKKVLAAEEKVEKKAKDEGKIKLEDLDQKLDEILEGDIM